MMPENSIFAGLGAADASERQVALIELRDTVTPDALEPLIGALSDPDAVVRRLAVEVLEELGDARAVPALVERLADNHPTPDLRRAAAYALGDIRASSANDALRRLAADPDAEVRKAAALALEAISTAGDRAPPRA